MPRIPSSKSFEIGQDRNAKIESILRADAERQIARGDLDTSSERLVKWLLSQENMMAASWTPSLDARRKIAQLPDQEGHFIQDGRVYWLADEARNMIIESRGYEAFKLLEKFDLTIIEKLEPALRREDHIFYCVGSSWFVRFRDGSENQDKWALFKDEKWIRCIALLLEHPYQEFSPSDILGKHIDKKSSYFRTQKERREIEKIFRELDKDDNYDEAKWRQLIEVYKKEVRIKRKGKGEIYFNWLYIPESDRIGVTQHIREGKNKIKKSLPHLGDHLRHLKGGYSPRYIPPEYIKWHIHW